MVMNKRKKTSSIKQDTGGDWSIGWFVKMRVSRNIKTYNHTSYKIQLFYIIHIYKYLQNILHQLYNTESDFKHSQNSVLCL